MAHEQRQKEVSNLFGIETAEQNVLPSDQNFNSKMDANSSQALIKHDNYKSRKIVLQDHGGRKRHQEQVYLFDKDSIDTTTITSVSKSHKADESTKAWDQSIELTHRKHRKHHASKSMSTQVDNMNNSTQLIAEADAGKAIYPHYLKSHSDSIPPSASPEASRLHHDKEIDTSNSPQDSQEAFSSKSKQTQMKVDSDWKKRPQDGLFLPLNMGIMQEAELPEEPQLSREKPAPTDATRKTVSLMHKKEKIQCSQNDIVERMEDAQPIYHKSSPCLLSEEKFPAQTSHRSRKQNFAKPHVDFSNERSICKNCMEKSQADDSISLESHSVLGPGSGIAMCATQNLDNVATMKSIDDDNEKDVFSPKAALAYAPSGEPLTRQIQAVEATIPPHVQSEIALIQTDEERPGAYLIAPSGSAVETTRLSSSHENWSGYQDFEDFSRQDVMSNNHAQGQCSSPINIDEEQVGTNENYTVVAHMVEDDRDAVFAEVLVWYKRPSYRWMLLLVVVLIVATIVLRVCLGAGTSAPSLEPTSSSAMLDAESKACSFLNVSMDVCRATTVAYAGVPQSMIPTELGVLTNLSKLSLDHNQLIGTIPSEIGAMTSLSHLSFLDNELIGTIPSEIGAMTSLSHLSFSDNKLTGTIPSEIGAMTSLTHLSFSVNKLTSTIPSKMGAMASLLYLDLTSNELTGTIPPELGAMTSLTYLNLTSNQLNDTIPPELGAMTSLLYLDLTSNELTGTIPSEFGAITSLTYLDLSENELTGMIPSEMGALTSLTFFDLAENLLKGTIPSEMGAMTSLTYLSLSGNELTGTFPSEMGKMTNLFSLYLAMNQLTSTIPSEIGAMTSLTTLDLSILFTGTIPSEIGAMTGLTSLILWWSQLTGNIPSEIGAMTSLTSLYLYENQLNGTIPSEMGTMTCLSDLSLSRNELTGTIPSELGAMISLDMLSLEDNQLNGTIPSELSKLNASLIHLYNNSFSGTISTELCQSALIYIDCGEVECSCCSCN